MRPPLSAPDGTIIREDVLEFDGKELSVDYELNLWASCRTQAKSVVFMPVFYIIGGIWLITIGVWFLLTFSTYGIGVFTQPFAYYLIKSPAQMALVTGLFFILVNPIFAYLQIREFDGQCIVTLAGEDVSAKPKQKERRTFFHPPISIPWKRIRIVKDWAGDVFVYSFFLGVSIPREAFLSEEERQLFINTARQFRSRARQKHWDTKPNH